ncbi:sterol desaturase family protein [uncultured Cyclobacterium sp.]|uniref:sterol desaturase family protein n=1 Tax=uncultured Cyclobacterium sp. TaxID=453820 RepID=UPI0030ECA56A|tara:strand:- start:267894 stop:268613 length:720 start_codon:yes stop_codon:yes gene_type:complete
MEPFIEHVLYDYSYLTLFGLSFGYFLVLYFGVGSLFLAVCKYLESHNLLHKIRPEIVSRSQVIFEIKHSLKSIVVFGFSIIPVIYFVRLSIIELLPNTWLTVLLGLIALTLWNEVHFYLVHRLMHQKFMMKKVHCIHHKSHVPTVFSVYSFHWVEAFLLSTVPLTILPFMPFAILAVFIFPLISILLNFAGHCNYRFGNGTGNGWEHFGTYHNEHHSRGRKNYGFALNFLDKIFSRQNR